MLSQTKYAVLVSALTVGAVWVGVGCTIKEVDPIDTSTNVSSTTTTSASSGSGGGSSTSNSGSGSGGGNSCVGVDGTGVTAAACDMMAITPAPIGQALSNCGPGANEAPPGYDACLSGFDVYTAGSFENLQTCLNNIGVEPSNACDEDQVFTCLDKVYAEACPQQVTDDRCKTTLDLCTMAGQAFDIDKCFIDLAPLSADGIEVYLTCFEGEPEASTCQEAHDACAG